MAPRCVAPDIRGVKVAALFTKFDPRVFLDAGRGGSNAAPRGATLATLAALAGGPLNAENQPAKDAVVTNPLSVRNPLTGVWAAKVAKPAKDRERTSTDDRTDWSAEDWRARFDERAGFFEHDGGLTRVQAERQAFEC